MNKYLTSKLELCKLKPFVASGNEEHMDRFSELAIEDEYENPPKSKTEVQAAPEKARNSRQSCLKV